VCIPILGLVLLAATVRGLICAYTHFRPLQINDLAPVHTAGLNISFDLDLDEAPTRVCLGQSLNLSVNTVLSVMDTRSRTKAELVAIDTADDPSATVSLTRVRRIHGRDCTAHYLAHCLTQPIFTNLDRIAKRSLQSVAADIGNVHATVQSALRSTLAAVDKVIRRIDEISVAGDASDNVESGNVDHLCILLCVFVKCLL
jgi:hypothetical protein